MDHNYRVRWYQRAFHEAIVGDEYKRLIAIWHRRAGKDDIVMAATRQLTDQRVGTYWHCFPEHKQARKAIWNGVNGHTGKRRIDEAFPPEMRKRVNDDDMFMELRNGSTWQLLGSDRYDSTVGSGPVGVAYSEWALCNPSAWAYHKPMLEETGGKGIFITTPRGNNHAKTMYDRGRKNPRWFAELLTVADTHALTPAALEDSLQEYQDLYGKDQGEAFFRQEYYCSFSGALVGAYFGAEMFRAEEEGRFKNVPIDWGHPVHKAWDLGKAVNNPIWCFQVIAGRLRVVDFYRPDSDDIDDWVRWLHGKGYHGNDYVPHDVLQPGEWGKGRLRIDILREAKGKPVRIPMVSIAEGMQAGRKSINDAIFHLSDDETDERSERVRMGCEGLKAYRRVWDDDLKRFHDMPLKDWSEHIGSAWRYLALSWRVAVIPPEKKIDPKHVVYTARADGGHDVNMNLDEMIRAHIKRKRTARGED